MNIFRNEEALDMLDVSEEVLGRLAEEGKVKSRRADGTIYFLREEIEKLVDLQIEEVRAIAGGGDESGA